MTGPHSPWDQVDVDALHEVTEPAQVAILTDPRRVRFLRPFLARSATVTQAAEELRVTPNTLLYRVRRMLAARLLRVIDERPRAGRAVKIYRSSHDGYRVPMSAMRYDDLRHRVDTYGRPVVDDLARAYTAALREAPRHDRVLVRNAAGDVISTDLVPTRTRRGDPLVFTDAIVGLTREQAEGVHDKIEAAIAEALRHPDTTHADSRRTPFFVIGALLPMPD